MDKAQAIHNFWSSFGLTAYDANSVPDGATLPYITYNVSTDSLDNMIPMSGYLWYRSTSWESITKKSEEIARALGEYGFFICKIDDGYLWMTKGSPFAQRMDDPDDTIKRIYVNVNAEFLTAY